jgi:hypothetical protein
MVSQSRQFGGRPLAMFDCCYLWSLAFAAPEFVATVCMDIRHDLVVVDEGAYGLLLQNSAL